ncbi:MAG: hypothetical protein WD118_11330 [Phycisphaeraceae bacterium]
MPNEIPRPRQHLSAAGKLYPGAWRRIDHFRAHKGREFPDWPDWCFVPIAATYGIVADDAGVDGSVLALTHPERLGDPARLAAMATWRITQGIYRFDPALYASVIDTPVERDLPCDVLYRLPEWCVYVETPDLTWMDSQLYGFWAHLEYDINTGRHELRLLMDSEADLTPLPLHLGNWSLSEALERVRHEAVRQSLDKGLSRLAGRMSGADDAPAEVADQLAPLLSLLLYLCSQPDEIGGGERVPGNPRPKRTKQGWRLFPVDKPLTWDVGVRIGAALRRAYHQAETDQVAIDPVTGRTRPRAHIRRAHWHGFWRGPRDPDRADERRFELRWLPPLPVNVDDAEELPATIRPVKGDGDAG